MSADKNSHTNSDPFYAALQSSLARQRAESARRASDHAASRQAAVSAQSATTQFLTAMARAGNRGLGPTIAGNGWVLLSCELFHRRWRDHSVVQLPAGPRLILLPSGHYIGIPYKITWGGRQLVAKRPQRLAPLANGDLPLPPVTGTGDDWWLSAAHNTVRSPELIKLLADVAVANGVRSL